MRSGSGGLVALLVVAAAVSHVGAYECYVGEKREKDMDKGDKYWGTCSGTMCVSESIDVEHKNNTKSKDKAPDVQRRSCEPSMGWCRKLGIKPDGGCKTVALVPANMSAHKVPFKLPFPGEMKGKFKHLDVKTCCCGSDFCNAATSPLPPLGALLAVVAAVALG